MTHGSAWHALLCHMPQTHIEPATHEFGANDLHAPLCALHINGESAVHHDDVAPLQQVKDARHLGDVIVSR